MKILIVDNTEPEDKKYNNPLIKAVSKISEFDVVNYKDIDASSIDLYKGVILSGVPLHYSFDSIDKRLPYIQWVLSTKVPVLGICLGLESIGRLFGAEIIHDKEAENGTCMLEIVQNDPIFQNITSNFEVKTFHRGSITLPSGFVLLASSKKCKNQIIKHAQRNIYGTQFHPEFSDVGGTFLTNFMKLAEA